jgi:hypothetical protein
LCSCVEAFFCVETLCSCEEEELVHPAISTSTEPMIALHKVICLISVSTFLSKAATSPCVGLHIVHRSS